MRNFIGLFLKNSKKPNLDPFLNIKDEDIYRITTLQGRTYRVPGAWIKSHDSDQVVYKDKYYYIYWDEVESIIPESI